MSEDQTGGHADALRATFTLTVDGQGRQEEEPLAKPKKWMGPSPFPWVDPVIEAIAVEQTRMYDGFTLGLASLQRFEYAFAIEGILILDESRRQSFVDNLVRGRWIYPALNFSVIDSHGHPYKSLQGYTTGGVYKYRFVRAFEPNIDKNAQTLTVSLAEIEWKVMDTTQETLVLPDEWKFVIPLQQDNSIE